MMFDKPEIKGISVCNPVDVDREYLLFTVEYAHKKGFNHLQVIGPIHDGVRGNIDGMTPWRKYGQFNDTRDQAYMAYCLDAVNAACEKAAAYGIKMYQWHHELEFPTGFKEVYPEIVNSFGDIEVTHPLVKDFLEHKILDFFTAYPGMDGIILTLHETKIPLLKLKDQKLGKVERVKYVTQILYDTCMSLGKELIVRPFASIEEDYAMMAKAYEEISTELMIMDKWTQFDWSLTLPHNAFYKKIRRNPLFVEADIFGEFFGKGHLPLMLKNHITEKFRYCEQFKPKGYVARIDRTGQIPFGDVNEVNNEILWACLRQKDVDKVIDGFFAEKYPDAAKEVRGLMEFTEEILKKTIYVKGYYFSELSFFPGLNHCKNHFYFDVMRQQYRIASDEWYIPGNWNRGNLADVLEEKDSAAAEAARLYERLMLLEDRIEAAAFHKLWRKFANLKLVTQVWKQLVLLFMDYAGYFTTGEEAYAEAFEADGEQLLALDRQGRDLLGDAFYCLQGNREFETGNRGSAFSRVETFVKEIRESFLLERTADQMLREEEGITDYIICGGAMEGHMLQKEVNFSDTLVREGMLCRIPGNRRGMQWSSINAHGWFSYEVRVKPRQENRIKILLGSVDNQLDVKITIGQKEYILREAVEDKKELEFIYGAETGDRTVRIRFDKISGHTPCVYTVKVM